MCKNVVLVSLCSFDETNVSKKVTETISVYSNMSVTAHSL